MAEDLYKTLQVFFFFPLPPEAAITEAVAADKPAGVDKDPAVARPITARQIKTTTTKKKARGCSGRL